MAQTDALAAELPQQDKEKLCDEAGCESPDKAGMHVDKEAPARSRNWQADKPLEATPRPACADGPLGNVEDDKSAAHAGTQRPRLLGS